jgi:undecaprenyl-diphosphatase
MTPFDAIILGVVEGITEFLPVSSTGHLVLTSSLLGIVQTEFVKTFEIAIQMGGILAVIIIFWKSFLNVSLLKKLAVAFIPTGIIGLALYNFERTYLLGNEYIVLGALFVGGVILVAFEWLHHDGIEGSVDQITYKQAALIGVFQSVAIIPGVSRSGASIIGGLTLGLPRNVIVEFSFLLAVPTLIAATSIDLAKNASAFTSADISLLSIGFITAFIAALGSIHWLLRYVRKHSFTVFGVYRILLALLFFFFII